eukprot:982535-Heterocapsa_arctica.AAC.1
MAVIGMFAACMRRLASGTRLRRPTIFARRSQTAAWPCWRSSTCSLRASAAWRKRTPGHDGRALQVASGELKGIRSLQAASGS